MKNIISLTFIALFLFLSCLPEDTANSRVATKKLLKTITINSEIDPIRNEKWEFFYDVDSRLKTLVLNNDLTYSFTYDKNKITKFSEKSPTINRETTLYYKKITSDTLNYLIIKENNVFKQRKEYTFNVEKLVETIKICTNEQTCEASKVYKNKYKLTNISETADSTLAIPNRTTFTHDTKNNPFKNHNIFIRLLLNDVLYKSYNTNNVIKEEKYDNISDSINYKSNDYDLIYDSDDFPTSVIKYNSNDEVLITYKFEYQ